MGRYRDRWFRSVGQLGDSEPAGPCPENDWVRGLRYLFAGIGETADLRSFSDLAVGPVARLQRDQLSGRKCLYIGHLRNWHRFCGQ